MNLKAKLFSLISGACRRLGYDARFYPLPFNDPSLDSALRRLSAHQIAFNSLIDVGASNHPMAPGRGRLPGIFLEGTIFWSTQTRCISPPLRRSAAKCLTGSIVSPL
jgi:hypothetical protein